ncbi:MAG: sterol desaturase family protein [Pseudomonadota bacterium]
MKPELLIIFVIFVMFALLEVAFTRFFKKPGQAPGDEVVEIISTLILIIVTQPLALFAGGFVASLVAPNAAGALAGLPVIAGVALFLIFDDMTQYWWHRASHSIPWLYKLHRPHHNAEYLSIRVVYRNNLFYYALMPGLWFSGALIYLGLGWIYAGYIIVKMAVIYGAHCDVRWDEPLYKIKWLSPVMWIVERTISTPATHSAHHGKYASDEATHYKGNYGNLLFFWDILFGTAKITRRYPEKMGVENLPETSVGEQLLWPLVTVKTQGATIPAE